MDKLRFRQVHLDFHTSEHITEIGEAYRDIEVKEPWCDNAISAAEVAILSSTALNRRFGRGSGESGSELGAAKVLQEGHIHFDMIDQFMNFNDYRILVLPNDIPIAPELQSKLEQFLNNDGKLIMSGASGLRADGSGFAFEFGATYHGISAFQPDHVMPVPELCPSYVKSPVIMYYPSHRIKVTSGRSLEQVFDPYFNRTYQHLCSHQHAPFQKQASEFDAGVMGDHILYFAHPVFTIYHEYGTVVCKEYILHAITAFINNGIPLRTTLPSQGRITPMEQPAQSRYTLHWLYANTVLRGGLEPQYHSPYDWPAKPVEVIEELNPVSCVKVNLKKARTIRRITLDHQGKKLGLERNNGRAFFDTGTFSCHQMVAPHY